MDDGEEEGSLCPLCLDPLDATDKAINYCQCGYKMCLWCWNQIMETAGKENMTGRCPNCRTEYDKDKITMGQVEVSPEEQARQKKREGKKKAAAPVQQVRTGKSLLHTRVVQRNLVYAVGLPLSMCREEILADKSHFGAYGRVKKVSVNRTTPFSQAQKNGLSGSAYITYLRPEDALRCIEAVDGVVWEGKTIKACFGTTKYCNAYLKGLPCNNSDCLYLHEVADAGDSFSKDDMLADGLAHGRSTFFNMVHPTEGSRRNAAGGPDGASASVVDGHGHAGSSGIGGSGRDAGPFGIPGPSVVGAVHRHLPQVAAGAAGAAAKGSGSGGNTPRAGAAAPTQPMAIAAQARRLSGGLNAWASGDAAAVIGTTHSPTPQWTLAGAAPRAAPAPAGPVPPAAPVPLTGPLADQEWPSLAASASECLDDAGAASSSGAGLARSNSAAAAVAAAAGATGGASAAALLKGGALGAAGADGAAGAARPVHAPPTRQLSAAEIAAAPPPVKAPPAPKPKAMATLVKPTKAKGPAIFKVKPAATTAAAVAAPAEASAQQPPTQQAAEQGQSQAQPQQQQAKQPAAGEAKQQKKQEQQQMQEQQQQADGGKAVPAPSSKALKQEAKRAVKEAKAAAKEAAAAADKAAASAAATAAVTPVPTATSTGASSSTAASKGESAAAAEAAATAQPAAPGTAAASADAVVAPPRPVAQAAAAPRMPPPGFAPSPAVAAANAAAASPLLLPGGAAPRPAAALKGPPPGFESAAVRPPPPGFEGLARTVSGNGGLAKQPEAGGTGAPERGPSPAPAPTTPQQQPQQQQPQHQQPAAALPPHLGGGAYGAGGAAGGFDLSAFLTGHGSNAVAGPTPVAPAALDAGLPRRMQSRFAFAQKPEQQQQQQAAQQAQQQALHRQGSAASSAAGVGSPVPQQGISLLKSLLPNVNVQVAPQTPSPPPLQQQQQPQQQQQQQPYQPYQPLHQQQQQPPPGMGAGLGMGGFGFPSNQAAAPQAVPGSNGNHAVNGSGSPNPGLALLQRLQRHVRNDAATPPTGYQPQPQQPMLYGSPVAAPMGAAKPQQGDLAAWQQQQQQQQGRVAGMVPAQLQGLPMFAGMQQPQQQQYVNGNAQGMTQLPELQKQFLLQQQQQGKAGWQFS